MNILDEKKAGVVQALLASGFSLREVVRFTGHHKNTVNRYRSMMKFPVLCECGQSIKHRGWCSYRFARSQKRQEFMQKWHKSRCRITPRRFYPKWVIQASRQLGRDVSEFDALARIYTEPCPACRTVGVIRVWMDDPRVCEKCMTLAANNFNNQQVARKERMRLRGVLKQMGELGLLIRQARKLIHENNE